MRAMSILEAIGEGIISVPETLWDGIKRTGQGWAYWDTKEEIKISRQNERAYRALKKIFTYGVSDYNSPISKTIRIILYHFYESLPPNEKKKIFNGACKKGISTASKVLTSASLSFVVSKKITKKIAASNAIRKLYRYGVSIEFTLLTAQGMLYKAGAASDRLKAKFPRIWSELKQHDLDMVYFLIEKPMAKYLEAIRRSRMGLPIEIHGDY